ncbi:MAG: hypothetical protein FRX49_11815 [Trebouxia sp. A1-2]|nr:MAG: hypothetical protein FRX49_11815 [Trebouxia sp. A1-2]
MQGHNPKYSKNRSLHPIASQEGQPQGTIAPTRVLVSSGVMTTAAKVLTVVIITLSATSAFARKVRYQDSRAVSDYEGIAASVAYSDSSQPARSNSSWKRLYPMANGVGSPASLDTTNPIKGMMVYCSTAPSITLPGAAKTF